MIFIRTDANKIIATGHVMRCMTIARELVKKNQQVRFLVSDHESTILLKQNHFDYIELGTSWDDLCTEKEIQKVKEILTESEREENESPILFVDSYYVKNEYFSELKDYAKLVMIDDLCQNVYDVDVLINYNITYCTYDYEDKYQGKNTRLILGTNYVPLREQFSHAGDGTIVSDGKNASQILLICGGGDPFDVLNGFLEQVASGRELDDCVFHVVAGAYNPYISALKKKQEQLANVVLHTNVTEMADLMCRCDIAIAAASTVLYECCACSLPTIFYVMADNQLPDAIAFSATVGLYYAGDIRKNRNDVIKAALNQLQILKDDPSARRQIASNMHAIVDGRGSERLVNALLHSI